LRKNLAEMPALEEKGTEGWDTPLAGSSPGLFVELKEDGGFGL